MNKKDNPVPSLDNIINIIESCDELQLPNGAKGAIWKEDLIYKLQNGVETNKEQPILNNYDKQTLIYLQECLDEELSIPCKLGESAYNDVFLPRWEELKKRLMR